MADPGNTCEGTPSGMRRIGLLLGPALALGMLAGGPVRGGLGGNRRGADGGLVGDGSAAVGCDRDCAFASVSVAEGFELRATAQAYAHPLIFLFLGAFCSQKPWSDGSCTGAGDDGRARRWTNAGRAAFQRHGRNRLPEHVGQQHRHSHDYDADRAVDHCHHAGAR